MFWSMFCMSVFVIISSRHIKQGFPFTTLSLSKDVWNGQKIQFGQFLILSLLDFYTSWHMRSNIDFFFFPECGQHKWKVHLCQTRFMIPSTDTNDPYQSCISAFLQETIKVITLGRNSRYCVSVCVRACAIPVLQSVKHVCETKGQFYTFDTLVHHANLLPSIRVSLYVCAVLDAGGLELLFTDHHLLLEE